MSVRWPWRGRDHLPELRLRSRVVRLAQTLRGEPDIRLITPDAVTLLAQAACVFDERVEALRYVVRQLTQRAGESTGLVADSVSLVSDVAILEEAAQRASSAHVALCERLMRENKGGLGLVSEGTFDTPSTASFDGTEVPGSEASGSGASGSEASGSGVPGSDVSGSGASGSGVPGSGASGMDCTLDRTTAVILERERARFMALRRVTRGSIWQESLIGAHLADGMLRDVYERLAMAGGIFQVAPVIAASTTDTDGIVAILDREIEASSELAARLALFGRRLVGEVVLLARGGLRLGEAPASSNPEEDAAHADALFSLVIAAHSRRMSAFGLTA